MREVVRDKERLIHILDSINRILNFAEGKSKEDLEAESLKFFGIIKNIEIIGEASYKLTSAYKTKYQEIPWEAISKMRHVLVHDYYQIDLDQVWNVINYDLEPLRKQIENQIQNTDWEEWNKNDVAVYESAVHKSLIQTASLMKKDGLTNKQISRYTGLREEEIEDL
ncbi:MAG: DUF86 domain-containing protein [Muribaculaceae bacterium]|nr:DUF86 domain-containing protein [Muribaculaceae bacterium]